MTPMTAALIAGAAVGTIYIVADIQDGRYRRSLRNPWRVALMFAREVRRLRCEARSLRHSTQGANL